MSLQTIYVTRHGFRSNWVVDSETGQYTANIPSPTGIPSDPALAGYGVQQAKELAEHLVTLDPAIDRVYSSPFYRCLQTINPTLEKLSVLEPTKESLKIRGDHGIGEWYGTARFDHPAPAEPMMLYGFFPRYDLHYVPSIKASVNGETIDELHNRTAYALHKIIEQADEEGDKSIIICTHAATLIAIGRALTGNMPLDTSEQDFKPFTCSLSKFVRRSANGTTDSTGNQVKQWQGLETPIPEVDWKNGKGVGGGWNCELNGFCGFLSGGEERGWHFSGDEAFSTGPNAVGTIDASTIATGTAMTTDTGPTDNVEVGATSPRSTGSGGSRL